MTGLRESRRFAYSPHDVKVKVAGSKLAGQLATGASPPPFCDDASQLPASPPRFSDSRGPGPGRLQPDSPQDPFTQANGVAVRGMAHPTADAGVERGERDFPGFTLCHQRPQLALEVNPFPPFQPPPVRIHREAKKGDPFRHRLRMRAGMEREPQPGEPFAQPRLPLPERWLVVGEEHEVIHVAHAARVSGQRPPPS